MSGDLIIKMFFAQIKQQKCCGMLISVDASSNKSYNTSFSKNKKQLRNIAGAATTLLVGMYVISKN